MKGRHLLLDAAADGASRAALLQDGVVDDLLFDPPSDTADPGPGDLWQARLGRTVPGIGGAFVDLGSGGKGYLREGKGLTNGSLLPVQVTGCPEPGKAVPVSPRLLFKGRHLIVTPGAPGVNVSRQIRDETERTRLTALMSDLCGTGLIVRTAAEGVPPGVLQREAEALTQAAARASAPPARPGLIARAHAAETALREWTQPLPDAVLVTPRFLDRVASLGADIALLLEGAERVETPDLFDQFGVWETVEALRALQIPLPSGGWMSVEATRALVAVDVNTGSAFGGGAGLSVTLDAIRALPRALRLRGLGGQIVVDPAPLKKAQRRQVEDTLRTALRRCPVETSVVGWTPLGHIELTRKRERRPIV